MPHPLTTATLLPAQTPPALNQPHSPPELEQASRSLDTAQFAAWQWRNHSRQLHTIKAEPSAAPSSLTR